MTEQRRERRAGDGITPDVFQEKTPVARPSELVVWSIIERVDMRMKNPPHPGLSVRHDCLEPLGLSVAEGAKALGITRQAMNNLVSGKAGISAEMAIRLDKAFGGGAETWLRMQAAYDSAQVEKRAGKIKVRRVTGVLASA